MLVIKYPEVQPTVAPKLPVKLTIYGNTHVDDYYWLKEISQQYTFMFDVFGIRD